MKILVRMKMIKNKMLAKKKKIIIEKKVFVDDIGKLSGGNRIASGTQLFNTTLGYGTYIGRESKLNNVMIGKYSCIGPRLLIIRGEHPLNFVSVHPAFYSLKKQSGFTYVNNQKFDEYRYADNNRKVSVVIGNDVWIGADVRIIEGVTISDGAVILAGAVVTKDVEPYEIVGGVPAKHIKYRFETSIIEKMNKIKWWNSSEEKIRKNAELFDDISTFMVEWDSEEGEPYEIEDKTNNK